MSCWWGAMLVCYKQSYPFMCDDHMICYALAGLVVCFILVGELPALLRNTSFEITDMVYWYICNRTLWQTPRIAIACAASSEQFEDPQLRIQLDGTLLDCDWSHIGYSKSEPLWLNVSWSMPSYPLCTALWNAGCDPTVPLRMPTMLERLRVIATQLW